MRGVNVARGCVFLVLVSLLCPSGVVSLSVRHLGRARSAHSHSHSQGALLASDLDLSAATPPPLLRVPSSSGDGPGLDDATYERYIVTFLKLEAGHNSGQQAKFDAWSASASADQKKGLRDGRAERFLLERNKMAKGADALVVCSTLVKEAQKSTVQQLEQCNVAAAKCVDKQLGMGP